MLTAAQLAARDGRLLARFERFYVPEPNSGCWIWTGALMVNGYGVFTSPLLPSGLAHRASYELHRGPIPPDRTIDHLCRTRCCVNPDHMEVVTRGENARRAPKPKLLVCKWGHDMADAIVEKNGTRRCRACHRRRTSSYYQRNRGGTV